MNHQTRSIKEQTMQKAILTILCAAFLSPASAPAAPNVRALIIDGQNNHAWQQTTPVLKKILEDAGIFQVDVLTTPPAGGDFSKFKPAFSTYKVVISNYNDCTPETVPQGKYSIGCPGGGSQWPQDVKSAFEQYVKNGGGFVVFHAADNAFPDWPAYNLMIGVGGWFNRDEKSGPYWYYNGGKLVSDRSAGIGGSHGTRLQFQVTIRDTKHPITKGLPEVWKHETDELYARLRGPGENMTVLATAFSDPANKSYGPGGSGREEPMLMTISYGKGRVFHTTLGNDIEAMKCVGFITTLQRGTEWAATGTVTQKVPADFPTADKVSLRPAYVALAGTK
jgi:type 1 glutamine amidotransferase